MNHRTCRLQSRFMRPDARRYLRSDHKRFLAPERKWDGQPRIEAGEEGAGQFTFGTQDGGQRPRVYITGREGTGPDAGIGDGDSGSDAAVGNELDDFLIRVSAAPGMGHNNGPPLSEPPEIPETKPRRGKERTAFARAASTWIGTALGAGAGLAAAAYIGILNNIEWLKRFSAAIETYRDPPKTLEELQAGARQRRPGYEDHHIMEQTAAERWGMSRQEIDDRANVVSIPVLKHYEITGWYQTRSSRFGDLSPREYLVDKGPEERYSVGLEALRIHKVLK